MLRRAKPLKVTYGLGIDEHDTEGRLICAEYPTHYGTTGWHVAKVTSAAYAVKPDQEDRWHAASNQIWCWSSMI